MNAPTAARCNPAPPAPAAFDGWHDSSLELRRGLVVTEHGPLDPLPAEWATRAAPAPRPVQAESLTRWIRPQGGAR